MHRISVGVIGLGKFGYSFASTLTELGHDVVGLDSSQDRIKSSQNVLSQVYVGDAMDKRTLEQLGFGEFSHVLVSVGHSIESSTMIALYLKELKTPNVWVKAISHDHEKLLRRIGVDEVIFPEFFAAQELANRIAVPGLIAYVPFDRNVAIKEVAVDKWSGKTLVDLDLTNTYGVQVISLKLRGEERYRIVPKPMQVLQKDDTLVILGHTEDIERLKP